MVSPDPHTDAVESVNLNEPVNLMNPKSTATRNAIVRQRRPAGGRTCRPRLAVLRSCAASTPQKPLSHRWERKGTAPVKRLLPGLDGTLVASCAAPKHRMCISGWAIRFWNQPIRKS
jgi:hypothetical protein